MIVNELRTYKILFPLHEYGFSRSRIIRYDQDINIFKDFSRSSLLVVKVIFWD